MKIINLSKIICLLILLSLITTVESTSIEQLDKESTSFDDDVPIWNNGDSWTYSIDSFTVDRSDSSNTFIIEGKIDNFRWTVADTSGSKYKVDFSGKLDATYEFYLASAKLSVKGIFNPSLTRLKGSIFFEKSNLEISSFNADIIGITSAIISPIPIPIPIPIRISADGNLDTPMPILDFPLADWKLPWALPEINVVTETKVGGILGIIGVPITFSTHYDWTPLAFWCLGQESVSVQAGTFDAWEISSIIGDYFQYYYAPSVGNIIKINVDLYTTKLSGQLKDTNLPH